MSKSNSQQKSTPDALIHHQQVGVEQKGAGGIAYGQDQAWKPWGQSEGANVRYQFKLWDSKRERIKLGKALNLGTTRRFPERRTEQIPEKS